MKKFIFIILLFIIAGAGFSQSPFCGVDSIYNLPTTSGRKISFTCNPWWNPFTMMQAKDCAHRIGQDKTVFSYSFITRGTIEEKILLLQKRKTELAGSIIPDEENFFSSLDEKELEELFG